MEHLSATHRGLGNTGIIHVLLTDGKQITGSPGTARGGV